MPHSAILNFEETVLKIESISNQLGMLHDCGANGANTLDNYVLAIFLMARNLNDCCKELCDFRDELFKANKERTK